MLSDRGRSGLVSPVGTEDEDGDEDVPESVRRYRRFVVGSTKHPAIHSGPEDATSIFISNTPALLMSNWHEGSGYDKTGRVGLHVTKSRQAALSTPSTSLSALSPISPNPDDSIRFRSNDAVVEPPHDSSPSSASQRQAYPVQASHRALSHNDSSAVSRRPRTPSPFKPRIGKNQDWWNLCTVESTIESPVRDLEKKPTKGNFHRRSGAKVHGRAPLIGSSVLDNRADESPLRRSHESASRKETNKAKTSPGSPDGAFHGLDGQSEEYHSHDASSTESCDAENLCNTLSEQSGEIHGPAVAFQEDFRTNRSQSPAVCTHTPAEDDEAGMAGAHATQEAAIESVDVGQQTKQHDHTTERKRPLEVPGGMPHCADVNGNQPSSFRTSNASSEEGTSAQSMASIVESTTALAFTCGIVEEGDRGAWQAWAHKLYFGWPKRCLVACSVLVQCFAALGDQDACDGGMEMWLQLTLICCTAIYALDVVLLRLALGRSSFWKFNLRKLAILLSTILSTIDLSLRMAEKRTGDFARPFWPLMLLAQLPDVACGLSMMRAIVGKLAPFLLAAFWASGLLAVLGIMSVRFACPDNDDFECAPAEDSDGVVSYRTLPRAAFSVWALVSGDEFSTNFQTLSTIVGPVVALPFCGFAMAATGFVPSCVALAIVWHHFRVACAARHRDKIRQQRNALRRAVDLVSQRSPDGRISAADVVSALDSSFRVGRVASIRDDGSETRLRASSSDDVFDDLARPQSSETLRGSLADLAWLAHPTLRFNAIHFTNKARADHAVSRGLLARLNSSRIVSLVNCVALISNAAALVYGAVLADANPAKAGGCEAVKEMRWECEGQAGLIAVDWVVYSALLFRLLLHVAAEPLPPALQSLSGIASLAGIAIDTALMAHRHWRLREGDPVGGLSLLIRMGRVAPLLPLLGRSLGVASMLSTIAARALPPLLQLSLLLFSLLFSASSILALALPCSPSSVPGFLDSALPRPLASFHFLSSLAVASDWPPRLLQFLRFLPEAWAAVCVGALLLWWVHCRVVVGMMMCVLLSAIRNSIGRRWEAMEGAPWLAGEHPAWVGWSGGEEDGGDATVQVTDGGLLLKWKARSIDRTPGVDGQTAAAEEALTHPTWIRHCAVDRVGPNDCQQQECDKGATDSRVDTAGWKLSLRFWSGRVVEIRLPSEQAARMLLEWILWRSNSDRTCHVVRVASSEPGCGCSSWSQWTLKLPSFIDEMGVNDAQPEQMKWSSGVEGGDLPSHSSDQCSNKQDARSSVEDRQPEGEKEVSSLISVASTRKGDPRGAQEWSRRRGGRTAPPDGPSKAPAATGSVDAAPSRGRQESIDTISDDDFVRVKGQSMHVLPRRADDSQPESLANLSTTPGRLPEISAISLEEEQSGMKVDAVDTGATDDLFDHDDSIHADDLKLELRLAGQSAFPPHFETVQQLLHGAVKPSSPSRWPGRIRCSIRGEDASEDTRCGSTAADTTGLDACSDDSEALLLGSHRVVPGAARGEGDGHDDSHVSLAGWT